MLHDGCTCVEKETCGNWASTWCYFIFLNSWYEFSLMWLSEIQMMLHLLRLLFTSNKTGRNESFHVIRQHICGDKSLMISLLMFHRSLSLLLPRHFLSWYFQDSSLKTCSNGYNVHTDVNTYPVSCLHVHYHTESTSNFMPVTEWSCAFLPFFSVLFHLFTSLTNFLLRSQHAYSVITIDSI